MSSTDAQMILARLDALAAPLEARAWLTVDDVARLTKQAPETVQDKARRGLIPMFKDGREWKMTPAAFDAWETHYASENTPREARYGRKR